MAASGIDAEALAGADLVVENIVEDLAAKRGLLQRIEPWLEAGAVVASNTSSLRVGDMADGHAAARAGSRRCTSCSPRTARRWSR